jgi:hypothetical protein
MESSHDIPDYNFATYHVVQSVEDGIISLITEENSSSALILFKT